MGSTPISATKNMTNMQLGQQVFNKLFYAEKIVEGYKSLEWYMRLGKTEEVVRVQHNLNYYIRQFEDEGPYK